MYRNVTSRMTLYKLKRITLRDSQYIAGIKPPILIQDIQVVIEANISQWKVEHYDIELTCPLQSVFRCTRQPSRKKLH